MLERIKSVIVSALIEELARQGHRASGRLIDSIGGSIEVSRYGVDILIKGNDYWRYVDKGRRSGTRRVPIDALVKWIKQRGIASGDKDILNAAWAIQTKIYQEGIPTRNAENFSKSGERTGFVDKAYSEVEPLVLDMADNYAFENFEKEFETIVDRFNRSVE